VPVDESKAEPCRICPAEAEPPPNICLSEQHFLLSGLGSA